MDLLRPLLAPRVLRRFTRIVSAACILGAAAQAPASPAHGAVPAEPAAPSASHAIPAAAPGSAPETVAIPVAGTSLVEGRSTIIIGAPIEAVRKVVLDFAHYPEFMPHYRQCRVLRRTQGGGREVYMEVSALNGVVTMWARVEVRPSIVDGAEVYETKFLEGNVKDMRASWRLRRLDASSTEVTLDVFLSPGLPLPDALVNRENLNGAAEAVLAVQNRVTGR